jgi:hypothetical protein
VQWQLDPLHFLVTLDRFTGLGHGIDQRELDAFGVALTNSVEKLPSKYEPGSRFACVYDFNWSEY